MMRWTQSRVVLGLLVVVLPGCGHLLRLVGKPKVRDVRPRIAGIDLHSVDLAFDVDIHNPYPIALRTPAARYGLDIEGAPVVRAERTIAVDLPAWRVGTLTLPVRLAYRDLWQTARKLVHARQASYRLHGTVALAVLGQSIELPLARDGTFPILRPPRFTDLDVDVSHVAWDGARVILTAEVENPNVFPLDIRDLGYTLALGDTQVGNLLASTSGPIEADGRGRLTITGRISAAGALARLLRGARLGSPKLTPAGFIKTPYGEADLSR